MSEGALYAWLADAAVVLHLGFVVFVVLGGLTVWRWPVVAVAHVPAVAWAAWIELAGRICPLTPLEVRWRTRAGEAAYESDFVAHYVLPVLYPTGLTRDAQVALGVGVLVLNAVVYALLVRRRLRGSPPRTVA